MSRSPTSARKASAWLGLVCWIWLWSGSCPIAAESAGRFVPVDVWIETGATRLASYQVFFEISSGNAEVVGLEGGEAKVFSKLPRHDRTALPGEKVIIADYSLANESGLPRGRVRVARIHLIVEDGRPLRFEARLQAATDIEGKIIVRAKASAQPATPAVKP